MFKWIKEITLDPETGKLVVIYNYDNDPVTGEPTKYETDLRWVKNMTVDAEGTVFFDYTSGEDVTLTKLIKWIDQVTIDNNGHLTVTYNHTEDAEDNPTTYETDLRYVNNIEVASDGTVILKFTHGDDIVLSNKIKWITETALAADGTFTITYNDNTSDVFDRQIKWIDSITFTDAGHLTINYNNGTAPLEKDILWITDAEVQTGDAEGSGNQKIKLTFNNGTTKEIGNPLNYIMQVAIDDRYHLLILYSDPAKRQEVKNFSKNATWLERDDWYDLGYIGNGTGVGAIVGKASDNAVAAIANTMPAYSAWFIIEEDE